MSEIRATTISDAAGTGPIELHKQSAAKAWVNWNGESTPTIRDSFGVSSLTDNATGNQTISFSSSFTNNDYGMTGMGGNNNTSLAVVTQPDSFSSATTSSVLHQTTRIDGAVLDIQFASTAYHGGLA